MNIAPSDKRIVFCPTIRISLHVEASTAVPSQKSQSKLSHQNTAVVVNR